MKDGQNDGQINQRAKQIPDEPTEETDEAGDAGTLLDTSKRGRMQGRFNMMFGLRHAAGVCGLFQGPCCHPSPPSPPNHLTRSIKYTTVHRESLRRDKNENILEGSRT